MTKIYILVEKVSKLMQIEGRERREIGEDTELMKENLPLQNRTKLTPKAGSKGIVCTKNAGLRSFHSR
jgi:hypothetical protein